ncbi:hypothetical protein RJT34_10941 [Clitoria ternatea]|uniref:Uncharacterized protein n=1 Tax=Clitoria ternatea TaxID=43366 RepID=A0AAN9PK20_CLITE
MVMHGLPSAIVRRWILYSFLYFKSCLEETYQRPIGSGFLQQMAAMDRNEVAVDIERMLSKAKPPFTAECCIYRVPLRIRNLNTQAYTPRLVSIGPFHSDNPLLQKMESLKQSYCKRFIKKAETCLDDLVNFVQQSEPNIRAFNLSPSTTVSIVHFTDLLRMFHLQPDNRQPSRGPEQIMQLNSATELTEVGVKFRVNKKSNCLLELELSGRYLQIPEFTVHDWTEIVFRNMVALEQCHYPDTSYITDYIVVLDYLINTGKDVDILIQNGIISNWIGHSDAVAKLYNGLCKNIVVGINFNSEYLDICKRLNEHCKHPWNKWKATLRRDYCQTPWQIAASAAAILLLILTIIQIMAARDRNEVAIKIERMLSKAKPPFTAECCIYRVPLDIRNVNTEAYTPRVVSIGPFHSDNAELQNMKSLKQSYCKRFIKKAETCLDDLVNFVQQSEPKIRACYSDEIKYTSEEFVELLLVDCGFIIELLMEYYPVPNLTVTDNGDEIIPRWLINNIATDLLLLENQLPFSYVEKLYNLAFINEQFRSLLELTLKFFNQYNTVNLSPRTTVSIVHFTDLLRMFHLQPEIRQPSRVRESIMHLNNATELTEAGMKFMVNKNSNCLLDLKLSGCYLQIPKFTVDDTTEIVFRNMVALEQCHYPDKSYITDYIGVLDFLINTGKDVDVLIQNGIISNWIGDSDAVAKLYNGLCKNIGELYFNSEYLDICKRLNDYCKHPWNKWKATLRREYCKTPWQIAASAAAILLLILTVIQTVCSILQVL